MIQAKLLELHKRRDFSAKLSASIDFIRLNAKPLIKALLFICGPFILLGAILMAEGYSKIMNLAALTDPGTSANVGQNILGLSLPMISGFLFLFIAGTLLISTVYQYVVLYDRKKTTDISVSEVWKGVKEFVWLVLASLVIWTVIIGAIYFAGIFVVIAMNEVSTFLAVIAGIALGLAVIYAGVTFSMVFIVQAYERKDVFTAFGRAFRLIRGKWWSTFGIILVSYFIQTFVTYIFMMPWYVTFFAGSLHAAEESSLSEPSLLFQIANYATLSIGFLGSNLLYAFPLLAIAFQYFNLVEMKESRGLLNKIENFGEQEATDLDEEHY